MDNEILFNAGGALVRFPRRPLIMGIVNVNDDSFSGDGSLEIDEISTQISTQVSEGADIIDLGAESARTNREAITEEEELRRLLPVLAVWKDIVGELIPKDSEQHWPPLLSINTWRPAVIQGLLSSEYAQQIHLINDMSALAFPETLELIKGHSVALLIMHSVGLPKQNHEHVNWNDIMGDLASFFTDVINRATAAGVARDRLILDPGLDFAKQTEDSLVILNKAYQLSDFSIPVLLPLSRKNFIGDVLQEQNPTGRDAGTVACLPFITGLPASIVRVHNVQAIWQGLKCIG